MAGFHRNHWIDSQFTRGKVSIRKALILMPYTNANFWVFCQRLKVSFKKTDWVKVDSSCGPAPLCRWEEKWIIHHQISCTFSGGRIRKLFSDCFYFLSIGNKVIIWNSRSEEVLIRREKRGKYRWVVSENRYVNRLGKCTRLFRRKKTHLKSVVTDQK